MLVGKKKRTPRPSAAKVEAVSEALKEIEAHFEMMGFSSNEKVAVQEEIPDMLPEDEESEDADETEYPGDEDQGGSATFDREEIEVALDVFMSHLVREKIINKYKRGKLPSLSGVFQDIFGDKHSVIKPVKLFEEHIEGYFDVVGYEDMEIAFNELASIRAIIDKELNAHASE
jgi:hypothetical protein